MNGASIVHLETEFHCQIWRKRGIWSTWAWVIKHTIYTVKLKQGLNEYTGGPPHPRFQLSAVYRGPKKKNGKLKQYTVHKFRNAHQARTGRNMAKSSSPNAPSTWLAFICPRTYTSPQTCHHSASSFLAVRISCSVIAVFVFREQEEELKSRWTPKIG